ncbi:MAG: hypothetical protein QXZ20_00920, partial [Candidatus Aenigmatarchaeota archaeon]
KDYKYLTLVGELYDNYGKLHDREIIVYDYSNFPFIPAFLSLSTEKNEYKKGEDIIYKITYDDGEGYPISGNIAIEITDDKDNVLISYKTKINGFYEKTTKIDKAGMYKIIATDTERNLKTEKNIIVLESTPIGFTKLVEDKNIQIIIFGIIMFIIVLVISKIFLRLKK